jgi:poly(3-hydroxybutyrate) depolymerase
MLTISNNTTIFVAPDGLNAGWGNTNGQDLIFTDSILSQVKNNFCIDTTRIFACGFSYGGGMSYAIACDRAPVFRAVGVFSGAQLSGCVDGTKPIAYYASHGLSDPTCKIDGGRTLRDHFVKINGCTAQTPPEPTVGSGTHLCTTYTGCSNGHPVRWCAFDGVHDPSPKDKGQSVTWNGQEVWNFFTQF